MFGSIPKLMSPWHRLGLDHGLIEVTVIGIDNSGAQVVTSDDPNGNIEKGLEGRYEMHREFVHSSIIT
jgi:hypothetical protein